MKANFHCAHLHNLSPQGTGDVPTALSIVFTTPSVPLVGDRNGAQTASLYGWRTIRGLRQQQSCGFLCGDKPQGHGGGAADATAGTWGLLLMGTQGHNAGCGDDNTFYSTLDRIDSGEVPIRVMAEIL